MNQLPVVLKRELKSYFSTPVAYVFTVIFLMMSGAFTFYFGGFYEKGQANLQAFFYFHIWLYLFLIPAVSMGLWSQERQSGTIELLMTLPISKMAAVLGKFLAAWLFAGGALLLTFPIWITVNYLGEPDNGVIIAGYLGSWMMAGGFLAMCSCMSACSKNQVVAFILGVVVCFLFIMSGQSVVLDWVQGWAPQAVVDAIASMSFITHFQAISRGVIDLRDFVYFITLIAAWLWATAIVIDMKKAD